MESFTNFISACLLHDIGKVVLRALGKGWGKTHAKAGAEWLSKFDNPYLQKIIFLVENHHNPQDAKEIPILALLRKADYLAAGERETSKEKCKDRYQWDWYAPLATPFSRISLQDPRGLHPAFWPVEEISPVLPQTSSEPIRTNSEKYNQILKKIEDDFRNLFKSDIVSPNKILVILEKYLSFVPSETCVPKEGFKDWPDISLFDHLKLTGAVASAYYLWLQENFGSNFEKDSSLTSKLLESNSEHKPFLLVGGDLSGVQNFIYTISSEGALCSLKGRSFFLELLMEHVIEEILTGLGLYRCNVIFSGGGHFYLLLPNTKTSVEMIKKVRDNINEWLWKRFGALLELHIDWEAFGEEVFLKEGTRAGKVFVEVSRKLEERKRKPFWERLTSMFQPQSLHPTCLEEEGAPGACEVCFRDDVEISKHKKLNLTLCKACLEEFELGKNIQSQSGKNLFSSYLFSGEDGIKIENKSYKFTAQKPQDKEYVAVNHFSSEAEAFLPVGYYQGIWKFEKIKEEGFGSDLLAALRMDVDNLGRIFKEGLAPHDQTFSRVSAISRSLNLFFKYYLNSLLCGFEHLSDSNLLNSNSPVKFNWAKRDIDQKGRKAAIIYSGGDDLFILGAWLDVCECAIDIIEAFSRYTGNPELTLSGGLVLGHIKMPVYQLARLAGEGEEKAKGSPKKNALFILGQVISNEYLKDLKNILNFWQNYLEFEPQKALLKEPFSKSFLYHLLHIAQKINKDNDKENKTIFLPRLVYLLARLDREKFGEDYLTLQNWLLSLDFEKNWKLLHIVTQWIIMSMRREQDAEE